MFRTVLICRPSLSQKTHAHPVLPCLETLRPSRLSPPKNYSDLLGTITPERRGSGSYTRITALTLVCCILYDVFWDCQSQCFDATDKRRRWFAPGGTTLIEH